MTLKMGKQVADNYLEHFGILGMKWGIQNFDSPKTLQSWMKSNIKYSEFTHLKSPEEVFQTKTGSCHDQVLLELSALEQMGLKPKATFLIEYKDGQDKGGVTHSFAHFDKNGKTYWLENAWKGQEGLREFDSLKAIESEFRSLHASGKFGNSSEFPDLQFAPFDSQSHTPGETLNELVEKSLAATKHGQDFADNYLFHFGLEGYDILKTESSLGEDLAHYGVLGMKWGVLRSEAQLGRVGSVGGRFPFSSKKKLAELQPSTRTKRLSELTDEELNKVIARLQKEKLYKDLVNPQGGSNKQNPVVQKGETIVHKMLSALGTSLATKFAEGAGVYLASKFTSPRKVQLDAKNANEKNRLTSKNDRLAEQRKEASDLVREKRKEDADWARTKRNESDDRALAKREAKAAKRKR